MEIIGKYILRKPNFRQKMTSLIVPKNLKEGTLWDCSISIMLQNFLKIEGGPFREIEQISRKKRRKNENCRLFRFDNKCRFFNLTTNVTCLDLITNVAFSI